LLHAFLKECAPGELEQTELGQKLAHPERIVKTLQGSELSGWKYRHPLIPSRECPVVLGAHATAETGTGLVHTAPGHGEDDFHMGVQHGLPIWAPVDGLGRSTGDVGIPGLEGVKVFDANPKIVELLASAGALLHAGGKPAQIR